MVGAEARYIVEVNGTGGAVRWSFERLNGLEVYSRTEAGDAGWTRVVTGPDHPDFARFQPGTGIPMGYDDLKVIEAARFLQSVTDGEQRPPGVHEIERRGEGDRRHRAIVRVGCLGGCRAGAADPRRGPALDPGRRLHVQGEGVIVGSQDRVRSEMATRTEFKSPLQQMLRRRRPTTGTTRLDRGVDLRDR